MLTITRGAWPGKDLLLDAGAWPLRIPHESQYCLQMLVPMHSLGLARQLKQYPQDRMHTTACISNIHGMRFASQPLRQKAHARAHMAAYPILHGSSTLPAACICIYARGNRACLVHTHARHRWVW